MANPSNDWVGQTLSDGRYRVDAKLGEGGMGFVYKVWDRNLDTDLVIKVPRRSMLDEPEFARRFALEIRSLVKLSHPNIVKVSDVGIHGDLPFAVMQFLPGGDLEGKQPRRADGRPAPTHPSTLVNWLPGVASALDFIHGQGYIHRDVKPANILFDAIGHAFLSDFGVAKVLGSVETSAKRASTMTGAGMVLGTPEYMARELIMGEPFDGRVDQYALAATTYEVLCGRKPFAGDSATAIMVRQANAEPPPLIELDGPGASGLIRVILKALSKDPNQRFATCGTFAAAIVAAASEVPAAPVSVHANAPSTLRCPCCGNESPIPANVLADPSRVRGRKVTCKACQGSLRFADHGLSLVMADSGLGGQAETPRSGTVILGSPLSNKTPAPQPLLTTTVQLQSLAGGPVEPVEPGHLIVVDPASLRGDSPRTVAMSRLNVNAAALDSETERPPGPRVKPWMIAAGVAAVAMLIGVVVLVTTNMAFRPTTTIATATPTRPKSDTYPTNLTRTSPTPDPEPTPPPPRPRPTPRPRPIAETSPIGGETSTPRPVEKTEPAPVVTPTTPKVEPPPVEEKEKEEEATPEIDDKTTFDQLVKAPENFVGEIVIPNELLRVNSKLTPRRGGFEVLTVECKHGLIGVQKPSAKFEIVAAPEVASRLHEVLGQRKLVSGTYPAILSIKVQKDPANPGKYLGIVEKFEFLLFFNRAKIAMQSYGRAFTSLVVTGDSADLNNRGGDRWRARLNVIIPGIRHDYQEMKEKQRDQMFNKMEQDVMKNAAAMSTMLQKQQADMINKVFGSK